MKLVIHKHQVPVSNELFSFTWPLSAKVIHIGMQDGMLTFWTEYDENVKGFRKHNYRIVPTGGHIESGMLHKATVFDGMFVWHVYRDLDSEKKS